MDLRFSAEDEAFREEARAWLTEQLQGEFAVVRGRGGPGDEHSLLRGAPGVGARARRRRLDVHLVARGVRRPRACRCTQQVIFYEEYARAGGPGRVGIVGEGLLGPTIIALRHRRAEAPVPAADPRGEELWCQGYSEPNAGSDLANVQTRAELDGDEWVIDGQKVWTSLAHWADWCFVLCRTDRDARPSTAASPTCSCRWTSPASRSGPSCRSPAPRSSTRCSSTARARRRDNVVGDVNDGWRVAMGTLAFERGASTLGQQLGVRERAATRSSPRGRANGTARRSGAAPAARRRVDRAEDHALQRAAFDDRAREVATLTPADRRSPSSTGRRCTAASASWPSTCSGLDATIVDEATVRAAPPRSACSSTRRADTIYGGSNQIQRNVIGERVARACRPSRRWLSERHDTRLPARPRAARRQDRRRDRRGRHRHRLRDGQALRRGGRDRRRQRRPRAAAG